MKWLLLALTLQGCLTAYEFTPSPSYFDGAVIRHVTEDEVIGIMGVGDLLHCNAAMKMGFVHPITWTGEGGGTAEAGEFISIVGSTYDHQQRYLQIKARIKDRRDLLYLAVKVHDNKLGKAGTWRVLVDAEEPAVEMGSSP